MGVHAAKSGEMKLALDNFREALRWAEADSARFNANLALALALTDDGPGCVLAVSPVVQQFSEISVFIQML